MVISVASGKGGTGKTTVSTNLAYCLENVTFLDCDVEEPDAHIFLKPDITLRTDVEAKIPCIMDEHCTLCGDCSKFCRYNALAMLKDSVLFFPELCHHCGGCALACTHGAIEEKNTVIGRVETGAAGRIKFVHGISEVGTSESTAIIQEEKSLAGTDEVTIIDAAPGTSCLMVEAVRGSDYCILVTEPTPFGLNDLELAVQVASESGIPFGVVINRADVGDRKLTTYCGQNDIPILMEIPFERRIAESYSKGYLIAESIPEYRDRFIELYSTIQGDR